MRLQQSVPNDPVALTPAMAQVLYRAHASAPAATPVILYGETGTGKTFLAEYIHRLSGRSGGFHAFSVGTVSPQLAADELFGHVPGAYTDAHRMRAGLIARAGSGTLLLDDLQTLDLGVQKQLLQVLDRGTYSPVGSDRIVGVGCRIILAMTEEPDALMEQGLLLKDLRYRFGACSIRIPPLRERRAEIPVLAQRALERCPELTRVDGPSRFSDAALEVLCVAEYKGNVRQLEGIILAAYLMARMAGRSEIDVEHLPEDVCSPSRYRPHGDPQANWIAAQRMLKRTGGNIQEAAQLLGISRTALHELLATRRDGLSKRRKVGG
jgi:DNA-binding NtrC family response regulator